MKSYIAILTLVMASLAAHGQSLVDHAMQEAARQAIMEMVNSGDDTGFSAVSVAVMDNGNGNVLTLLDLKMTTDGLQEVADNDYRPYYHDGNTMAIMYLLLLESGVSPDEMHYTPCVYRDSASRRIRILDHQVGDPCYMSLKVAMDRSDVVMVKALEKRFGKSMREFAYYLNMTGSWLGDTDQDWTIDDFSGQENDDWQAADAFAPGEQSTTLQMAAWMQAVANDGKMMTPRLDASDKQDVYMTMKAQESNIGLLKEALRDAVLVGCAKSANSPMVPVSGMVNVTVDMTTRERCAMFNGFIPGYTVTVNLVMRSGDANDAPAAIARNIIEWIANNRINNIHQ